MQKCENQLTRLHPILGRRLNPAVQTSARRGTFSVPAPQSGAPTKQTNTLSNASAVAEGSGTFTPVPSEKLSRPVDSAQSLQRHGRPKRQALTLQLSWPTYRPIS
jgi:hypothetical protein